MDPRRFLFVVRSCMAKFSENVSQDYVNWEFFHAAQANNVPRLKELLDQGVNINQQDTDTQNCALHYASMKVFFFLKFDFFF